MLNLTHSYTFLLFVTVGYKLACNAKPLVFTGLNGIFKYRLHGYNAFSYIGSGLCIYTQHHIYIKFRV
nr:MAG TPA: hypothetical protein [Caudoviricetes sp.]